MLTIHSRQAFDLRFDAGTARFSGVTELRYSLAGDPDTALTARIRSSVSLPRWTRFGAIESALIQAATTRLMARLEEVETDPVNIFAAEPVPLTRAA